MAELVFQTWERITGRPWSDAAAGGFTDGSFDANIALQKRLLAGFNPFSPTSTKTTTTTPTAPKEATVASTTLLPIDPGLLAQQWEAMLTLEKYIADLQAKIAAADRRETGRIANLQAEIDRATLAQNQLQFEASLAFEVEKFGLSEKEFDQRVEQFRQQFGLQKEQFDFQKSSFQQEFGFRREQFEADFGLRERQFGLEQERFGLERNLAEAELAANPSNFVALQLYKRSLEEQGIVAPSGQGSLEDEGIQDLFATVLGLEGGPVQGEGQFGVGIPTPGAISRQQAGQFSESDLGLLESFLRGGIDVGEGEFAGINPGDFFQEVEEGFIPTIEDVQGLTEVRF